MFHKVAMAVAVAALTLAGCGGGGGSGGAAPVNYSPAEGAVFTAGPAPEFHAPRPRLAIGSIVYQFSLYTETGDMTRIITESEEIAGSSDGASWTPEATLEENQAYLWGWTATWTENGVTKSETSVSHVIRTLKSGGLLPRGPRDGGYLDANLAAQPRLAVTNAYTAGDAAVTYDFEISSDPQFTSLAASGSGAEQTTGSQDHTAWQGELATSAALTPGVTYYWRARAVIDGVATGWYGPYSFTVTGLCEISGSQYAEYVVEWHQNMACPDLVRTDTSEILGPPVVGGFITQDDPGYGFVSMNQDATLSFEMGKTIYNGPGNDLGVYEYVSTEALELFAGLSESGPWYSLGMQWCHVRCDFDLGAAGLNYARYFKIRSVPGECYQTAGPDIYGIIGFNLGGGADQCVR